MCFMTGSIPVSLEELSLDSVCFELTLVVPQRETGCDKRCRVEHYTGTIVKSQGDRM